MGRSIDVLHIMFNGYTLLLFMVLFSIFCALKYPLLVRGYRYLQHYCQHDPRLSHNTFDPQRLYWKQVFTKHAVHTVWLCFFITLLFGSSMVLFEVFSLMPRWRAMFFGACLLVCAASALTLYHLVPLLLAQWRADRHTVSVILGGSYTQDALYLSAAIPKECFQTSSKAVLKTGTLTVH